jgi:hypothetical protein
MNVSGLASVIFLQKIDCRMHSDPKCGWKRGGVSYIDAWNIRFWNAVLTCILRKNFHNDVWACSVTKIPLGLTHFKNVLILNWF